MIVIDICMIRDTLSYFNYLLFLQFKVKQASSVIVKISHNMQNPIKKEIGCIGSVSFFILDDSEYANMDW